MSLIKIDLDRPLDLAGFLHRVQVFCSIHAFQLHHYALQSAESKNGGLHVWLWFTEELCDLEILAIQAILGSDWVREAFNLRRIRGGQRNWNLLFEGR